MTQFMHGYWGRSKLRGDCNQADGSKNRLPVVEQSVLKFLTVYHKKYFQVLSSKRIKKNGQASMAYMAFYWTYPIISNPPPQKKKKVIYFDLKKLI